jgi:hypothetical protein
MNTFVFQPGMTWGKLGYTFYSNSLEYRKVLEHNPKWSVTELPPLGSVLVSGSAKPVVGLSQQPSIIGRPSGQTTLDYYPFSDEESYYLSLAQYNPSCLTEVERLNGWSMNSEAVVRGNVG